MARPRRRLGNLPAEATTFVGRRRELGDLRSSLAKARLVSLVGPGGVGKTRLALRAATDLGRGFADGAWWVDLGEIRDPGLVSSAAVAALDLRDQAAAEPTQILSGHLRDREVLLVVDNCEHVLDASAALVSEILRTAPNVRILATSREPLQVPGEQVVPVAPMELPPEGDEQPIARLLQNEAVRLFVERASAASGSFELDASNRAAVVGLCRRLDGLPLAIELAAVRTRLLSVEQIHARLADRFALLTGGGRAALPRQQTLRTTIDWSHDLLTAPEQELLRRLCVFAGRFTVEDVESVFATDELSDRQALDLLAALVDKSLVTRENAYDVACYRLHETMREYAHLRLVEAGEVEWVDDRFVEYYRTQTRDHRSTLLREIELVLRSGVSGPNRTLEWLQWLDLEIDNVRSALQKCTTASDWKRGLEIATSVGYYWITRGTTESIRWFDDLLGAAVGSGDVPARSYYFRGWLSILKGDPESARPWLAQAIAAARDAGQQAQLSESLSLASTAESLVGDRVVARRLLDEAAAVTQGLDHYPALMGLHQAQVVHALVDDDLATAKAVASDGARLSREVGDLYYLERMLTNLGLVAVGEGDLATSKARFVEGLQIAKEADDRLGQSVLLRQLGAHAAATSQPVLAARLLGAADALGAAAGEKVAGPFDGSQAGATGEALAAIGAARFGAEYAAGSRLDRDSALRLALDDDERADTALDMQTGPLSQREAEVARLIGEGLSNKEIATRLFISERTVTTHVGNILNKLGFDSRVQVASWISASDTKSMV